MKTKKVGESIAYKANRNIPATDYCKRFENNGDIIEYFFIWYKDKCIIENPPQIKEEDLNKIKEILRGYGVIEFKANLQLNSPTKGKKNEK